MKVYNELVDKRRDTINGAAPGGEQTHVWLHPRSPAFLRHLQASQSTGVSGSELAYSAHSSNHSQLSGLHKLLFL